MIIPVHDAILPTSKHQKVPLCCESIGSVTVGCATFDSIIAWVRFIQRCLLFTGQVVPLLLLFGQLSTVIKQVARQQEASQ